ncbi:MAG: 4Fe-4S dicluster domain-containing protein [Firmicutes bacterium]|nr:4Fe-4S dicluster domain-containing protein [Bacillota bacterium]
MAKIRFNPQRCIGCRACEGACKQENNLPVGVRWRVVTSSLSGDYPNLKREYKSLACHHCTKLKCAEACPVGAITKDSATGIVDVNADICIGCRACVDACPFGAMCFDDTKNKAGKCTLCKHRVKQGLLPACVQVCMGLAMEYDEE